MIELIFYIWLNVVNSAEALGSAPHTWREWPQAGVWEGNRCRLLSVIHQVHPAAGSSQSENSIFRLCVYLKGGFNTATIWLYSPNWWAKCHQVALSQSLLLLCIYIHAFIISLLTTVCQKESWFPPPPRSASFILLCPVDDTFTPSLFPVWKYGSSLTRQRAQDGNLCGHEPRSGSLSRDDQINYLVTATKWALLSGDNEMVGLW